MMGKTHMVIGIAAAMACFEPERLPELVAGAGAGALGGLIPDIDVDSSGSHKEADKVTALSIATVAIVIFLDYFFHNGSLQQTLHSVIIPAWVSPIEASASERWWTVSPLNGGTATLRLHNLFLSRNK